MPNSFEITQPSSGYRYSLDPFILANFMAQLSSGIHHPAKVADMGTGNGIIPILLSKLLPSSHFTGIDIQAEPIEYAKQNGGNNKNIHFIHGDLREAESLFPRSSFDALISNPPFRKVNSGRLNPNRGKAIARHEVKLTLAQLIGAAKYMIKDMGHFYLCHLAERGAEVIKELSHAHFTPKTIRYVHSKGGENAFLMLIESVKGGKNPLTVLPPLFVYGAEGSYSKEMQSIYEKLEPEDKWTEQK